MEKLQFFDIPVFLQKVKLAHAYGAVGMYSPAHYYTVAVYMMRRYDLWEEIKHCNHLYARIIDPVDPTFYMKREHLARICEEEWVDELMAGVEAIVNQNP